MVQTLESIIQKNKGVSSLYQHNEFSPGVAPAVLIPKKMVALGDGSDDGKRAIRAAASSDSLEALWQVSVNGSRIQPLAVAIAVKKQVIVPANGRWVQP